ncbi:MAG: hypothetical protein V4792_06635 [Pseudomonadota bacterium]
MRKIATAIGLVWVLLLPQAHAQGSAEQQRDALLEAMGGAATWRQVIGARITATHYSTETRLPYRNVIWNDFRRFRLHIEASNSDLLRVFGYDGEAGWRDDGSTVTPLTAARIASERAWWSGNFYRTLHRLALPDPALSVRLIDGDRLAVFEEGKGLLAWFRLNAAGEPLQFGSDEKAPGSTFGPLARHAGGARYPRWGSDSTGGWRYEVHDAEFSTRALVMPPLPQPAGPR